MICFGSHVGWNTVYKQQKQNEYSTSYYLLIPTTHWNNGRHGHHILLTEHPSHSAFLLDQDWSSHTGQRAGPLGGRFWSHQQQSSGGNKRERNVNQHLWILCQACERYVASYMVHDWGVRHPKMSGWGASHCSVQKWPWVVNFEVRLSCHFFFFCIKCIQKDGDSLIFYLRQQNVLNHPCSYLNLCCHFSFPDLSSMACHHPLDPNTLLLFLPTRTKNVNFCTGNCSPKSDISQPC